MEREDMVFTTPSGNKVIMGEISNEEAEKLLEKLRAEQTEKVNFGTHMTTSIFSEDEWNKDSKQCLKKAAGEMGEFLLALKLMHQRAEEPDENGKVKVRTLICVVEPKRKQQ